MSQVSVLYIEGSGDILGGGQMSLLELLENLDRSKFTPIVICPYRGNFSYRVEDLGIKILILKMDSIKRNPFAFLNSVRGLHNLIRGLKIDIIHGNTSRSTLYAGLAALSLKIPVIWHVRVIESEGLYDRVLTSFCTKFIAISKAVEKRFSWLLKKYPEKVTVIYNGVDIQKFNPAISADSVHREFNLPSDIPVAGVVGSLIPWKGQEYFIRAAAEVIHSVPDAKFLIVGDGENRRNLESLTEKLGLKQKVIFTGKRFDIPRIIAAMDVLVHSSILPEPFGRIIVEGMAMGKPVIATNQGGVPEIIEDGISGILIPPKNSPLMSKAIINLFNDKEKAKKIGLAARKRVEEKFNIEENTKKTEELYLQILNG